MNLLHKYKNGNYIVKIYDDGTKIRILPSSNNKFIPIFPENIDLKITNVCENKCKYCHEKSKTNSNHAKDLLNFKFLNTLQSGTELAIGGGNALLHPEILSFLFKMKNNGVISNLTINSKSLLNKGQKNIIKFMIKHNLINGLGISICNTSEYISVDKEISCYKNTVFHVINGLFTLEDFNVLPSDKKVLILGYKYFGNGKSYFDLNEKQIELNKKLVYDNLHKILQKFKVVSFDNLAIQQLQPNRFLTSKEWNQFYMGDDGAHTMYIDLVKEQFGTNSTSIKRFKIKDSINEMFEVVLNENSF